MSFNIKLEFNNMLIHHVVGIIHANRSPHLPCGLKDETILGLNLSVLYLNILAMSK